ncbi:MAG: hypothetical protein GWN14_27305 [candidate division Zixibacteria bacterium]|nr:hypothetical protein [candidate division Zixibacteria bacterium]
MDFISGYTYAQRPVSLMWEDRKYEVETVIAEWKTPEGKHFMVSTTSGDEFEIIYQNDGID